MRISTVTSYTDMPFPSHVEIHTNFLVLMLTKNVLILLSNFVPFSKRDLFFVDIFEADDFSVIVGRNLKKGGWVSLIAVTKAFLRRPKPV